MVADHLTFKSNAPLKRQLTVFFAISVLLLSAITSLVTSWRASQQIRTSFLNDGLQVVKNFAVQSEYALLTESQENAESAVEAAMRFKSVLAVAIFKANGEILSISDQDKEKDFVFDADDASRVPRLVTESENHWVFSGPTFEAVDETDFDFEGERKINGHVYVTYDKSPLKSLQNSIVINNLLSSGIAAVVILLVLGWGVNRLTRPLSNLSQTMREARDYKDYITARVEGAREIREMAAIYNQMMEQLASQNEQLEKHRDSLESEVKMRTKDLELARDNAQTANRHKSEFLANISHELRTPLQAIIGYADLAREQLELDCLDELAGDQTHIIRASHNLLGLINNILDLSKIEAGKMDVNYAEVDTTELLQETIDTVRPMADNNNNQLVVNSENLADCLLLDRQKMMQIFLNLLSNACKFTKSGTITFSVSNDEDYLTISVADTGVGIPEEQLEQIFEKFTQIDGSLARKYEGTGLGMTITRNLCDLMNGEISVKSQLNAGSTFSVKLPIQKKPSKNNE